MSSKGSDFHYVTWNTHDPTGEYVLWSVDSHKRLHVRAGVAKRCGGAVPPGGDPELPMYAWYPRRLYPSLGAKFDAARRTRTCALATYILDAAFACQCGACQARADEDALAPGGTALGVNTLSFVVLRSLYDHKRRRHAHPYFGEPLEADEEVADALAQGLVCAEEYASESSCSSDPELDDASDDEAGYQRYREHRERRAARHAAAAAAASASASAAASAASSLGSPAASLDGSLPAAGGSSWRTPSGGRVPSAPPSVPADSAGVEGTGVSVVSLDAGPWGWEECAEQQGTPAAPAWCRVCGSPNALLFARWTRPLVLGSVGSFACSVADEGVKEVVDGKFCSAFLTECPQTKNVAALAQVKGSLRFWIGTDGDLHLITFNRDEWAKSLKDPKGAFQKYEEYMEQVRRLNEQVKEQSFEPVSLFFLLTSPS